MLQHLLLILSIGFLSACTPPSSGGSGGGTPSVISGTPLAAANTVIQALNQLDSGAAGSLPNFINLFDPAGVQFAPDYNITSSDLTLTSTDFQNEWGMPTPPVRTWGVQGGSGNPIDKHVRDYFAQYVWSFPYQNNTTITLIDNAGSNFVSQGNLINNMVTAYSPVQYKIVEYHQPGVNPSYNGMDWSSLMVVLKNVGTNQWTLAGLVHGAWSI